MQDERRGHDNAILTRALEKAVLRLRQRSGTARTCSVLCPFHDDGERLLVVSPKKNLWYCPGACQTCGSVIDWVMKSHGVSFRHLIELLRDEHPSLAEPARIVSKGTTEAVKLTPFDGECRRSACAPRPRS